MKTIIITGCDSGFGRLLVDSLVRENKENKIIQEDDGEEIKRYNIIALCRDDTTITNFAEVDDVVAIKCDLSRPEIFQPAWGTIFNNAVSQGVYCLVNNAGVNDAFAFDIASSDEIERELYINYLNAIKITKMCIPSMKDVAEKGKGSFPGVHPRIIFVTSWTGLRAGAPMMGPYSATKAALVSAARSMYSELKPFGIYVSNIMPGFHITGMLENSPSRVSEMFSKKDEITRKEYGEDYPQKFDTNLRKRLAVISGDANTVVKKLVSVIKTDKPAKLYKVGWDAHLMTLLPRWIVEGLNDSLRWFSGMTGKYVTIP